MNEPKLSERTIRRRASEIVAGLPADTASAAAILNGVLRRLPAAVREELQLKVGGEGASSEVCQTIKHTLMQHKGSSKGGNQPEMSQKLSRVFATALLGGEEDEEGGESMEPSQKKRRLSARKVHKLCGVPRRMCAKVKGAPSFFPKLFRGVGVSLFRRNGVMRPVSFGKITLRHRHTNLTPGGCVPVENNT